MVIERELRSFDGTKIHYVYSQGSKPLSLVFVHGIGGNWTVWRKEMEHFQRRGYSTLAIDMRGHGSSDMPDAFSKYKVMCFTRDLHKVIQTEKIKNFVLIGHSIGGALSIHYCMHYHKTAPCSLILVEGTCVYPFQRHQLFDLGPYATHLLHFIANHKPTRQKHFSHLPDIELSDKGGLSNLRLLFHLLHLTPIKSLVKTIENVEEFAFSNKSKIFTSLRHLTIPTLLLAGDHDKVIPPKYSYIIKDLKKDAEIKILHNAQHHVIIDHPRMVSHEIERFLIEKQLIQATKL
ncbi:alpha/beta hydrolase [Candidatus Woesearchaeota archaeon]|nr:alpha/beta hydrolase [Candidatus Woesearchaeota archaeon]